MDGRPRVRPPFCVCVLLALKVVSSSKRVQTISFSLLQWDALSARIRSLFLYAPPSLYTSFFSVSRRGVVAFSVVVGRRLVSAQTNGALCMSSYLSAYS